jgi:hypothetical protein
MFASLTLLLMHPYTLVVAQATVSGHHSVYHLKNSLSEGNSRCLCCHRFHPNSLQVGTDLCNAGVRRRISQAGCAQTGCTAANLHLVRLLNQKEICFC